MGSNGLPSSVLDLFVGDVVSVCDAEEFAEAYHLILLIVATNSRTVLTPVDKSKTFPFVLLLC